MAAKTKDNVVLRLEMVVEYSDIEDMEFARDLVETAREYGNPVKADLTIVKNEVMDLTK